MTLLISLLKETYNSLTTELKHAKSKFENEIMQNLIDRVGPNPTSSRLFWSRINCFRKPAGYKVTGSLISNNVELVEPKEKADLYAKRLESIYSASNIDSNFDRDFFHSVNSNIDVILNKESIIEEDLYGNSCSSKKNEHITVNDIERHLKRLKILKAPDLIISAILCLKS